MTQGVNKKTPPAQRTAETGGVSYLQCLDSEFGTQNLTSCLPCLGCPLAFRACLLSYRR